MKRAIVLLFLFYGFNITAQTPFHGHYNSTTFIVGSTHVRDEGVSPLFYEGPNIGMMLGNHKLDDKKERYHTFSAELSRDDVEVSLQSSGQWNFRGAANYYYLWQISQLSSEKFGLKVGPGADMQISSRFNPAYGNSGLGLSGVGAIMLGTKADYLLRNKPNKRPFSVSLGVNLGLLNTSWVSSYPYVNPDGFYDEDASIFENREFEFAQGLRFQSRLDFNWRGKKRDMAYQISVMNDASSTGGDLNQVDQEVIRLMFTLMRPIYKNK